MFVLWMGGVADGFEVFGITRRTADVFRRTTTGCLEQEGAGPLSWCCRTIFRA
jgi:hypothetical protein